MLCIENIKFWCKIEGFLDRLNTPETVLRIILDENLPLPHLPGNTKQNTTDWQEHTIPPIELSPYQETYKIEFALYREGLLIGMGRTEFKYKESRKDCLDIVDREFRVTGKLVYELSWVKSSKPSSYITYEQVLNAKSSSAGKELVLAPQIKTEKEKKFVKKEEDDCAGICGCFAVRKKKKTETPRRIQEPPVQNKRMQQARTQFEVLPDSKLQESIKQLQPIKFINNPYVYFEQQLEAGKANDVQQLNRLCFYSKKIMISK